MNIPNNKTTPRDTGTPRSVPTNEELSDWAFVTVMAEHLKTCLHEGRFSQIQTMIKEQGFTINLYNTKKNKKG